MSVCTFLCSCKVSAPLGKCHGVRPLESNGKSLFSVVTNCQTVSQGGCTTLHPPGNDWAFLRPRILGSTWCCGRPGPWSASRCVVGGVPLLLPWISQVAQAAEPLLACLFANCVYLWCHVCSGLWPILKWGICFLLESLEGYTILGYSPLLDMSLQIFLPVYGFSHCLNDFCRA